MRMAQIGIASCGCVVAAHVEWDNSLAAMGISEREYAKDVRQSIREWMKAGLAIGRIDMDTVETVFTKCADENCVTRQKRKKREKAEAPLFEEHQ